MRRRHRRWAFTLLPLLVVLGSAELGLRAAGWPANPRSFDHNEPYWVLEPNLRARVYAHPEEGRSFRVSTDHRGLRAPLHGGPKPRGATRLLALGCSTTFGWGVEDSESWPARLEALAREAGFSGVEVINAGQPGHTSFQGVWLWDTLLGDVEPDVVLLAYVVQDARRARYTDRSQAVLSADQRFLKRHVLWKSRLYLGLRALLGAIQLRARPVEGDGSGVYRVPPDEYTANLAALIDRARAAGARPVLLGQPLEREGYTAAHRAALGRLARAEGVPYLDFQARMTEATAGSRLYFERDPGHANAAGNDLIARWTLDALRALELLPPSPVAPDP